MRSSRPQQQYARLRALDSTRFAFECSYDERLTFALKQAVPFQARRWNKEWRRWEIDPIYGPACADLTRQYLDIEIEVPIVTGGQAPPVETRLLRLEYLGRCKTREDGSVTASGWVDGAWSVVVSESVLRAWFEPGLEPNDQAGPSTLYGTLTVPPDATLGQIKAAYRKLAKQWHPVVCQEANAAERFRAITDAYDVLRDPIQRKRYDVGLIFQMEAERTEPRKIRDWWAKENSGYVPPVRCGWVLAAGTQQFAGFVVTQILAWEAIVNEEGKELVTSWPVGGDAFVKRWVTP